VGRGVKGSGRGMRGNERGGKGSGEGGKEVREQGGREDRRGGDGRNKGKGITDRVREGIEKGWKRGGGTANLLREIATSYASGTT